ncbi:MAG: leucine-rich repeat protein [Treponema sp.]|nr:leucine-rich repeat protein [Treponema sp.]
MIFKRKMVHSILIVLFLYSILSCKTEVNNPDDNNTKYYQIIYSSKYGELPDELKEGLTVAENTILTDSYLPKLTDEKASFKGWYVDGAQLIKPGEYSVKKDIMLVASWTTSSISYHSNFGNNPTTITGLKTNYTLTENDLPILEDDHYTFSGWFYSCDSSYNGTGKQAKSGDQITNNTHLWAKWLPREYSINYNCNGGSLPSGRYIPKSYTINDTIKLVNPEYEGCCFDGWYEKEDFSTSEITGWNPGEKEGTIELYAKWKPIEYDIVFFCNGGILPDNVQTTYTVNDTIYLAIPEYKGYTFCGWYESNNFNSAQTTHWNAGDKTGTLKFYAKWAINEYTITYICNGGSISDNSKKTYTVEEPVKLPIPQQDGNAFCGWYEREDFSADKTSDWKAGDRTGNLILYAKWDNSIYNRITNLKNSETIVLSGSFEYDVISALHDALTILSEKDASILVTLDLSEVTGLTELPSYCFESCTNLIDIRIPNTLKTIGVAAFSNCSNLKTVIIPNGITLISAAAFASCANLVNILIPDTVQEIQIAAFSNCTSLETINIPKGIKSISCFANCSSLSNITIPYGVRYITGFQGCTSLTEITIPNTVEIIGRDAFRDCTGLTEITIPNTVYKIESKAFEGCSNLRSINIPNGVDWIETNTFAGCSSLTSITIPNSVNYIQKGAFSNCTNLKNIVFMDTKSTWYVKVYSDGSSGEIFANQNKPPYNNDLHTIGTMSASNTNATLLTTTYNNYYLCNDLFFKH